MSFSVLIFSHCFEVLSFPEAHEVPHHYRDVPLLSHFTRHVTPASGPPMRPQPRPLAPLGGVFSLPYILGDHIPESPHDYPVTVLPSNVSYRYDSFMSC